MADTLVDVSADWQVFARCRETSPDVFYPVVEDDLTLAQAKVICSGCPVQRPCLDYALTNREAGGVWGGCDDRERRRILKTRR